MYGTIHGSIFQTKSRQALIRRIPAGHWFQYRVAAVTGTGSQGYYTSLNSFKSSKGMDFIPEFKLLLHQ